MLSLKTDVDVPTVRNKQENLEEITYFFVGIYCTNPLKKLAGSGSLYKWYRSPDPDP
jgi:hypothetical protein